MRKGQQKWGTGGEWRRIEERLRNEAKRRRQEEVELSARVDCLF
jgi:hypothetical protein